MSNPKFTPGPWIIRKERNTYEEGLSEEVWSIYAKQEDGLTFVADCGGTKYAGTHETARLISKAPEMYEELRDVHLTLRAWRDNWIVRGKCTKAINSQIRRIENLLNSIVEVSK